MADDTFDITHHQAGEGRGEYRAAVDGSDAVGRLTWVASEGSGGDVRVANHTLVPREIGGRGVAAALVDALVADAREQGFRIVPQCSYVERKFDEHPEWSDLRA